ncbi:rCG50711 [Rattus norvegicus]|uniref:RCG50711 n=1 Tax=Rattus norvegicus TaxID=10116 RepID=A6KC10_RAT|nr:rCG50711 [Rattus norvegicus]
MRLPYRLNIAGILDFKAPGNSRCVRRQAKVCDGEGG